MGLRETARKALDLGPFGDPAHHLPTSTLLARLGALPAAPRDRGTVKLLLARKEKGIRHMPERVRLDPEGGMPGDAWGRSLRRNPDAQLAIMRADVAAVLANGQSLGLFGDNLLVDLDLSDAHLPIGSRVQVGEAVCVVSPKAHNGCSRFKARFGADALAVLRHPQVVDWHMRGIYLTVVTAGDAWLGAPIEVLSRPG